MRLISGMTEANWMLFCPVFEAPLHASVGPIVLNQVVATDGVQTTGSSPKADTDAAVIQVSMDSRSIDGLE